MRYKIIIISTLAILALATGFVLMNDGKENVDENLNPIVATNSTDNSAVINAGRYVDYTEGSIDEYHQSTKILFFHASWCPQCRELDESIVSGQIPENVVIMKVDYDDNQSLRSKYGVTIQTTLVRIDDNGELIEKFVAYDKPTLAAVLENLL